MFLPVVILLDIGAVVSLHVRPGISVVREERKTLDPAETESVQGFNLGDVIDGKKEVQGMGAWSSIFQKLGSGREPIHIDALQKMLQSVDGDLAEAYVDPGLRQELENETVQKQIQNITADKELLTQIVQENPMVQQMVAANPQLESLVSSPEALQEILSPEILQKVQHGDLDEATLQRIMEKPKDSRVATATNKSDHESLLPKMMSSNAPALVLESGLMLKQVKAGDGKTFPKDGDNLFVEYAGYLPSGQLFDSTKNGDLFSFQLGASQVIPGWDVSLRHMSLGERAVMRVPAALAYGESGTGPIPPNSDLLFEVTFLDESATQTPLTQSQDWTDLKLQVMTSGSAKVEKGGRRIADDFWL
eukprot:Skav223649  [mRNA]  locus=scaffold46:715078:718645:- [translate_table: standard]